MWIVFQLPAMLIFYFAAKLVHAMPKRRYQCLLTILFLMILAAVSGIVFLWVNYWLIAW